MPAWLALMPLFAIKPTAMAVSCTEYPSAPATGATYLNVSPIIDTLVLALLDAAASTSENSAESDALNPNAVRASVTMSDVVARSSPDAAARFMMPSMPFSMSSVFQPAIAIYSKASADSVAENFVFLPISLALSVRAFRSSPVLPEIAETLDISASKDAPAFTACVPRATAAPPAAVSRAVILVPADVIFPPSVSSAPPKLPNFWFSFCIDVSACCIAF